MAISYVGAATDSTGAGNTSVTISRPSGVVDGDLLLLTLSSSVATWSTPSTPTDWSLWHMGFSTGTSTQQGMVIFYKFANGESSSYTFSGLASGRWAGHILAFRGVDPTTPKDVGTVSQLSTSTQVTNSAITPTTAGAWIIATESCGASSGVTNTTYSSSNMTVVGSVSSTAAGAANTALGAAYYGSWTSGSFTPNLVPSNSVNRGVAVTSALRPAASGQAETGSVALSGSGTLSLSGVATHVASGSVALSGSGTLAGGVAAPQNIFPNPSMETSIAGWTVSGTGSSITHATGTGAVGSGYLLASTTGTVSVSVDSLPIPVTPGEVLSGAVQVYMDAGAARDLSLSFVWLAPNGSVFSQSSGSAVAGTAAWTQRANINRTVPGGIGFVQLRVLMTSPTSGNAFRVDAAQLNRSATVLPYDEAGLGVSGALAASGDGSLTLTRGAISTSGSTALSGSGTLSLSGVATTIASGSVALSGSGTQARAGSPSTAGSTALSGSGTLTGTGVPTQVSTGAVALSGSGTLTGAQSGVGHKGTVALTGAGTLSGSGAGSQEGTGGVTLSGTGTLATAASTVTASGSLALSGNGTLARSGAPAVARSLPLSGSGTLAGTGAPSVARTAALSGSGTLSLSGSASTGGTGSVGLSGSGTLSLSGSAATAASGSLTLSGSGAVAVDGQIRALGSLPLGGAGLLELDSAAMAAKGILLLTGAGTLDSSGSGTQHVARTLTLAGAGALGLTGVRLDNVPRVRRPDATLVGAESGATMTHSHYGIGDLP